MIRVFLYMLFLIVSWEPMLGMHSVSPLSLLELSIKTVVNCIYASPECSLIDVTCNSTPVKEFFATNNILIVEELKEKLFLQESLIPKLRASKIIADWCHLNPAMPESLKNKEHEIVLANAVQKSSPNVWNTIIKTEKNLIKDNSSRLHKIYPFIKYDGCNVKCSLDCLCVGCLHGEMIYTFIQSINHDHLFEIICKALQDMNSEQKRITSILPNVDDCCVS